MTGTCIAPRGLRLQISRRLVNVQVAKSLIESNRTDGTQARVAVDSPDSNRPRQILNFEVSPHGIDGKRGVRRTRKVTTSASFEGEGFSLLL
jgi:hypothetical protein